MNNAVTPVFYPLQVKTYYSFLDSAMKPEEYAQGLLQNNYPGGAITDCLSIDGLPKYSSIFVEHGLNIIGGTEIKLFWKDSIFQLLLYIQNEDGYHSILRLLNSGKNLFTIDDLLELTGLAAVIKTVNSYFFSELNKSDNGILHDLHKIFSVFYLGIEIYSEFEIELADEIRHYASVHGFKTIAIPEIKYVSKHYLKRYAILQALKQKKTIQEIEDGLPKCYFLLSSSALLHLYNEKEIAATAELASSCNFSIFAKRGELYHVFKSKEESDAELSRLVHLILAKSSFPSYYCERAEHELTIVSEMGFSDYFLIVNDFVHFAKTHEIRVGPGRGSAASSLISFLLNITEIDPIKHKLIFERFLNPNRITMPDIDIDFEDTKREQIIAYLKEKYGKSQVMQIITYANYKSSSSLNALIDVRTDVRPEYIKRLTACLHHSETLEAAFKNNDRIQDIIKDSFYAELMTDAILIEGFPYNASKHASGVILNHTSLYNLVPVKNEIIGFEFPELERMSFLKLDILGLTNLTFIRQIEDKIIDAGYQLPLADDDHTDDSSVYQTLNNLNTMNIFQLESSGMTNAIATIKPTCFNDLIALIALYRPGPMGNISLYAKNKNNPAGIARYGSEIDDIVTDTYNIIIYQEQIMAIIQRYAGLSAGTADLFRRAITKKDLSKMEMYKADFFAGAQKGGKNEKEISAIYKLIEKFASYGFNKAHSTSYALIAYKLLAYKTYFPLEFYQAILDNESLNWKNGANFKKELKTLNLSMNGPRLHKSGAKIRRVDDRAYFPWSIIKGIDEETKNLLSNSCFPNHFSDIIAVFQHLLDHNVLEKDLKKLIDAGAFDQYEPNRSKLRFNFDSLSSANYVESSNSITLKAIEDQPIVNYISEYNTCGYVFSHDLKSLTNLSDIKNTYIVLRATNFNKTQFEALNDYGIITLFFTHPIELSPPKIITVIRGNFAKIGRYVNQYKEVTHESY